MSDFRVHILGCGSAVPTMAHYPSSQVIELRGKLYMMDCGEGTQRQFRLQRLNFQRLLIVCISHLHGDHCFGLLGLISTLNLLGRKGDLHIIGTKGLKDFLDPLLKIFCADLQYQLIIKEVETDRESIVYEDRSIIVRSFPLDHRMPCLGYVFEEKVKARHLNKWAGKEARVYAYMSDTRFQPKSQIYLPRITSLYHEATFLEKDKKRAKQTAHSTAREAALMAQLLGVRQLIIGHYSARYHSSEGLLKEAQEDFPETIAAKEGMVIDL